MKSLDHRFSMAIDPLGRTIWLPGGEEESANAVEQLCAAWRNPERLKTQENRPYVEGWSASIAFDQPMSRPDARA